MTANTRRILSLALVALSLLLLLAAPMISGGANWSRYQSELESSLSYLERLAAWSGTKVNTRGLARLLRAFSDGKITGAESLTVSSQFSKLLTLARDMGGSSGDITGYKLMLALYILLFWVTLLVGAAAGYVYYLGDRELPRFGKVPLLSEKNLLGILYPVLLVVLMIIYLVIANQISDALDFAAVRFTLGAGILLAFLLALAAALLRFLPDSVLAAIPVRAPAVRRTPDPGQATDPTPVDRAKASFSDFGQKMTDRVRPVFSRPAKNPYSYCPSCGCRLDAKDKFCRHCGAKQ